MSYTNRSNVRKPDLRLLTLSLALGILFQSELLLAQASEAPTSIDTHLTAIVELFSEIDNKAEHCIDDDELQSCEAFIHSLDTEFIGTYLNHCQEVTGWVDQIVTRVMTDSDSAPGDEVTAQRLIEAEYTCGKDALRKRTSFVVEAFGKWQAINAGNENSGGVDRRASSYSSQGVAEAVQSQNSRLNQEVNQQWQRIELENIRQQLRRP